MVNDLQDNLAQHLTLAKLRLESLASRQALRADPVVIELGDLLDYALTYSRTLMQYLRPPLLGDEDDLVAAIRWVAETMNRHGLNVEIEDDGLEKCLIEETLVLVYQTVQELLFNVLKHAKTPSAKISMRKNGEELEVAVFDQGARFASDAVQMTDKEGFGLSAP